MYLSAHVPLAIILGTTTGNPAAAFGVGLASHFLLDAVPHDTHDDLRGAVRDNLRRRKIFALETALDALLWVSALVSLLWLGHAPQPGLILASVAGGILPDVITGLSIFAPRFFRNRLTHPFVTVNEFFHWHPLGKHVDPPRWFSLPIQLMVILSLWICVLVKLYF